MRVVITAATVAEWMPAFLEMNTLYTGDSHRMKVSFHQSGVGMLASAVAISRLLFEEKPDLVIQAGIAGCFDNGIPLGKVVAVSSECVADAGVQEEGRWKDLFDLKLEKSSYHPYEKRRLPNPWLDKFNLLRLPEVTAVTINEISTNTERIAQIRKKYDPAIESMEGAALHYTCRQAGVPFLQVRAVSNYIGERNKANWKLTESIASLNDALLTYAERLYKMK